MENALVEAFGRLAPRAAYALKFAALVVAAILVVAAVAAAAIALWLRTYAPLDTSGGGKTVFFPAYRAGKPFVASFTLHNSGHFTATVEGLSAAAPESPPWVGPESLLTTASTSTNAPVAHTRPFRPLSLAPGDTTVLVVRFRLACPSRHGRVPSVFADSVQLRYRYLHWFSRTQTVKLPFAVTLRCVGGPLAKP